MQKHSQVMESTRLTEGTYNLLIKARTDLFGLIAIDFVSTLHPTLRSGVRTLLTGLDFPRSSQITRWGQRHQTTRADAGERKPQVKIRS